MYLIFARSRIKTMKLKFTHLLPLLQFSILPFAFAEAEVTNELFSEPTPCVQVLAKPEDSFQARRNLIKLAKHELFMSYFSIIPEDHTSLQLLALLEDAVKRGVKVKLIFDDYATHVPFEVKQFLRQSGIEVHFFNPIRIASLFHANRRIHDKYTLADRNLLLVGGRNLSDHYFNSDLNQAGSFYDVDALFSGTPASEAATYFDERWNSKWMIDNNADPINLNDQDEIDELEMDQSYTVFKLKIEAARKELQAQPTDKEVTQLEDLKIKACAQTQFYANNPLKIKRDRSLEQLFVQEINQAVSSIDIVNPYIVLTRPLKRAIKNAIARGVKIRMVTNSLASNDMLMAQSAYLNLRPKLLRLGIAIHEFLHPQTIHAKTAIFDQKRIIIGSFNLDPRSAKMNSENMIITEDPLAVQPIMAFFNSALSLADPIDQNGKPVNQEERHPGASLEKRILNFIYRYTLAPLLRGNL